MLELESVPRNNRVDASVASSASSQQPCGRVAGIRRCTMSAFACLGLATASVGAALPAAADASVTDLRIAARALGFTENPPSGTVLVGIVYSADAALARREAERVRALFGGRLRAGSIVLQPVMVEAGELATTDVDVFFVPGRVAADEIGIRQVSARRKIPCVTADIAQVESGACTIGVRSSPSIEVFVNRRAANASGIAFATAFRVMINEL